MRLIHAITIATLAGSAASAQPVAKQLVEDADAVETLLHQLSAPTANLWASLHLLEDLDADGVRDVLVTHQKPLPANPVTLGENFKAFVRSSRSGGALLDFPPDETKAFKTAHAAAVMIDDINDDGVRDIAAGRTLQGRGIGLRVHCGVTGEMLLAPYEDDILFPYGVSMIPWDDMDGDGQPDLLMGRVPSGGVGVPSEPFAYWSPQSGQLTPFRPAGYVSSTSIDGFTLLDLGVGVTGARELLATFMPTSSQSSFGFVMLGGNPLRTVTTNFDSPVAGAVRSGDFNDDGYNEVVLARGWPTTDTPPFEYGTPIFSGELPSTEWPPVAPLVIHTSSIVVELDTGVTEVRTNPSNAIVALGDATGDGFPDYAFLGRFNGSDIFAENVCLVAVCGRTGTAFFAAEQQNAEGSLTPVFPTRSVNSMSAFRGRDALVSPGDINNDGAPDLLLLVLRDDYTLDPPTREQLLLTHYLPTPCIGDADFDRVVDLADLNAVLTNFGAQDITLPADLNASGVVDFADLNLVLSAFGASCD